MVNGALVDLNADQFFDIPVEKPFGQHTCT
jgi:hypothetical protein